MSTGKNHLRTICTGLCAIVLFSLLFLPPDARAAENGLPQQVSADAQVTPIMDTTSLTQQEYLQSLQMASAKLSAIDALQPTCEWFIASVFAAKRDSNYDCTAFAASAPELDNTIAYLASATEYQRLVRQATDVRVLSDEITFDNFKATISGDTCTAEIGVHYRYEITGSFEETCYLNYVYYLELIYADGWKIVAATTSMLGGWDEASALEAFDVETAVQRLIEAETQAQITYVEAALPKVVPQRSGMTRVSYSTTAAVDYARTYFDGRNSLFTSYGDDCQNFASQCVWAGLVPGCGTSGSSIKAIPAISTRYFAANSPNIWCNGEGSTYYSRDDYNYAWANVNGFMNLISRSNYTQQGPQGYYYSGIARAGVGDVIAWDAQGNSSPLPLGELNHAMFVTRATGTVGSRGTSNLFIAAHTTDSESAYTLLRDYIVECDKDEATLTFVTADIVDGYYYLSDLEINTVGEGMVKQEVRNELS